MESKPINPHQTAVIQDGDVTVVCNRYTGEVLRTYDTAEYDANNHRHVLTLEDVKDFEMLQDYSKQVGWKRNTNVSLELDRLREEVSKLDVERFLLTAMEVEYGNVLVTTNKHLQELWKESRRVVGFTLNSWHQKGVIKLTSKGMSKRALIRIEFNPEIFRRGGRKSISYDNHKHGKWPIDPRGYYSDSWLTYVTGMSKEERAEELRHPSKEPFWMDMDVASEGDFDRVKALGRMNAVKAELFRRGRIGIDGKVIKK